MKRRDVPVLVIGAGPAGLATSRELTARGIEHLMLERGDDVGHTWINLYDSLTLHTGKHLSALPGMRFPRSTPLFPSRRDFVSYLREYASRFRLPVQTGVEVVGVERRGDDWVVLTGESELSSRYLVIATGIVANPRIPRLPGRERFAGRVMHSVEYRRPEPFVGRRVLIVGCGNSGGEIGAELAAAGVEVAVSVRSGMDVVPLTLLGVPIQYAAYLLTRLPARLRVAAAGLVQRISAVRSGPPVLPPSPHPPLTRIPLIGYHLVDAIREGRIALRPDLRELTENGVRFSDDTVEPFDDVILATGFAPATEILGDLVRRDDRGFALRRDRVVSLDHPNLAFVGHNYDSTGGLYNIARDAPIAAEWIARAIAAS